MSKSIYHQWVEAKRQLAVLKDKERKLRDAIELELRQDHNAWGTVKKEIDGLKFKSSVSLRYTIDEKEFDKISDRLSDDELMAVTYKLSLNVSEYKKLPENSVLRKAVTARLTTPQLSIEND